MKIFKELKRLGYIHYSATTIEELDGLPLNSAERISEQALVLRWFREKYGLHPHFCFFTDEKLWNVDIYAYLKEYGLKTDPCTMKFKAYEEAEYACLNKLIEIVKNNNNENLAHK
jgi:hypothetical protein